MKKTVQVYEIIVRTAYCLAVFSGDLSGIEVKMREKPGFIVNTETTLLEFLRECFPSKSRNHVKGLLGRGQIRVDGNVERHFALKLNAGQRVEIGEATEKEVEPDFTILHEDDELLVVIKPGGMLAISTEKEKENTLYRMVTDYVKRKNPATRVFIVHRLDRDTSGVMLFAKNEIIKHELQDNWEELALRRSYIAVVEGVPPAHEGRIESWLKQTTTLLVYSSGFSGDGKRAVTRYKLMQSSGTHSLLEIDLETGRKNQIRVHMSEMGNPVVGDKKYGAKTNPLKRQGLHATVLELKHPKTGNLLRFEAPAPKEFFRVTIEE